MHGHELRGTDAARIDADHAPFAREIDGIRWLRCLRCEAWVPLEAPSAPSTSAPPSPSELELPIRGRRLRDRYVLRLIVLDRILHILIVSAIAVAAFALAQHRHSLHETYLRVLAALQDSAGPRSGILGEINHLFTYKPGTIDLIGGALLVYVALLIAECVGLWNARRWAEYLTFVETACFIPFEIYELSATVSALKLVTLVLNLAIVIYLLFAHRLFGLRGGARKAAAIYGDGEDLSVTSG